MKERVRFFLKAPNANRETPINVQMYFRRERLKLATGMVIHPKHWLTERERAKRTAPLCAPINDILDKIALQLSTAVAELRNKGIEPTPAAVRDRFEVIRYPAKGEEQKSFFELYDLFIETSRGRLREGTVKIHRTAYNHLQNFAKGYGLTIDFENCNVLFFDKFLSYLNNGADVGNQTAWKIIRTLRVFLRHAQEEGHHSSTDYQRFTSKRMPKGDVSEKTYTTVAELDRIRKLNLSENKRLAVTRDLYLFQCHTGLRWADVQTIGPEHVHGDEIRLVTGKNRKVIRVPLLPTAKEILQRYEYTLPHRSDQKQNEYLKELCNKAKINRLMVTVSYKGALRVEKRVPKYELITTHSAKRSFVSILRSADVSIETICRLTGNSRRTIETYILKDESDMAAELERAKAVLS